MEKRYYLFKRKNTYYVQDRFTRKQESLFTTDRDEAERLWIAKNDAEKTSPSLSLALARTYLTAHNQQIGKRVWEDVMAEMATHGKESTRNRCKRAMKSKPFDSLRKKPILETNAEDFLEIIRLEIVSAIHYLRRLHNLALGLGWLPWPILAKNLWPKTKTKPRRAIRWDEHQQIVAAEKNKEKWLYYQLLWEIGSAQTDCAELTHENIDWKDRVLTFNRKKTEESVCMKIGPTLEKILRQLPSNGPLFPKLRKLRDTDRAKEFARRCRIVGVSGVTLHSYRYSWAQRAKTCGYPERWAQAALGHDSEAVHEMYAKRAFVMCPSLEEWAAFHQNGMGLKNEIESETKKLLHFPKAQNPAG